MQLVDGLLLRERALRALERARDRARHRPHAAALRIDRGERGTAEQREHDQHQSDERRHPYASDRVPVRRFGPRRRTVGIDELLHRGRLVGGTGRHPVGVLVLGPVLDEALRGLDLLVDVGVGVLHRPLDLLPHLVELVELLVASSKSPSAAAVFASLPLSTMVGSFDNTSDIGALTSSGDCPELSLPGGVVAARGEEGRTGDHERQQGEPAPAPPTTVSDRQMDHGAPRARGLVSSPFLRVS